MRTQRLVDGKYELYKDGVFFSRKKTEGAYKGVPVESDSIKISIDELRLHFGVHKAVINKIAPWIKKVLNGKV